VDVPTDEGVSGEGRGKRYSDAYIMGAAHMWASGLYPSYDAIREALGEDAPSRQTLIGWKQEQRPNGLDWDELRDRFERERTDAMTQELGQTVAEMNAELYRIGRATVQAAVEALRPGPFYLDPNATQPVDSVFRADGSEVVLRRVWPQTPAEYCRMLAEGAKQMRMGRGEASERVEFYNQAQDELITLLRRALANLDWSEAQINELERALEEAFGAHAMGAEAGDAAADI
jgi:Arc/MetJ-type ribon-helix-helix transcriptional regulator